MKNALGLWTCHIRPGAELGVCQGGPLPPKIFPGPPVPPPKFSAWRHAIGVGLFLKVLHRPLTTPLVAKLAPPNENVWLCPWYTTSHKFKENNLVGKCTYQNQTVTNKLLVNTANWSETKTLKRQRANNAASQFKSKVHTPTDGFLQPAQAIQATEPEEELFGWNKTGPKWLLRKSHFKHFTDKATATVKAANYLHANRPNNKDDNAANNSFTHGRKRCPLKYAHIRRWWTVHRASAETHLYWHQLNNYLM